MSKISTWSTTADDNNSAVPDGWAESMLPSGVNNTAREGMAQSRVVWNDKEWFEVGDGDGATVVTRTSNTTVTIPTNVTATHHVGRRVKIVAANTGTIYSHISISSYSAPNTTLTFASGTISSSDSTISLYLGSPYVNPAIPVVDEDAMGSDSAILPPSQQSVKAFVESGTSILTNKRLNSPKINEDVVMSSTSTELNIMDGVTSTTAEINILDGVTSTTAELNILDGVTSTTAELNILDGVTSTAAELNILDGVTSTTAELNILDGVTSTTAELNYTDGVTSAIQTQLDAKVVKASNLSDLASASTSRTNLGLGTMAVQNSGTVSISGGSITGMGTPSGNSDVSNKSYVDQAVAGLRNRIVAECASTANVNLSNALEAGDTIDGITLVENDRVLIKDNTDATENGLYLAVGSGAGAASRDPEHDSIPELSGGMIVVNQGSANDNKIFLCTTNSDGSIGSTNIVYTVITPSNSGTITSIATGAGIDGGTITSTGTISIDSTVATLIGTQTLTNKTLTSPKVGTSILDTNGNELALLTATGSAINEFTLANAAAGNNPVISATGGDTNIGINLTPKGSGVVTVSTAVTVDTLNEKTSANGITIDGLNIKDSKLVTADSVVEANMSANSVDSDSYVDASIDAAHLSSNVITGQAALTSVANDDLVLLSDTSGSAALKKMTVANLVANAGFSPYGLSAYSNAAQVIATGTYTKVTLPNEYTDTNGEFTGSTYTAVSAGDYLVSAQIYENGETGTSVSWQTIIYKNGSLFLRGAQTTDYAVGYTFPISAVVVPLSASDTIELYVLHNKGSNASINYDNTGTFLNVWRLR